ncbi:spry domain containing socs box protein [Anaeramoeba flamelloides]|uniref:Spry domain containing socs box protein n=1 Tax=Anaeramoeba flamelloides TaxID=1746091 RepID=A0AAV7ZA75_9EUKA|nr:spry domain containing socs box protein [Anaeramoeba flamelloides]
MKKKERIIKLIQGSKKIIEEKDEKMKKMKKNKEEKERGLKKKEFEVEFELFLEELEELEEEFNPKMNHKNIIQLKNDNKTAWNPSEKGGYRGYICGKKMYSRGKHEIKIKIDQFPYPKNEPNEIRFGVVRTKNREKFIKNFEWEGTYYFETEWKEIRIGILKLESQKCKIENGKCIKKNYSEEIYLKKNDIFTIFLDMDNKIIIFKINEIYLEGWEKLPESVNFFVDLGYQRIREEKNQITLIRKL